MRDNLKAKYWNDLEIPAKLFFNNLGNEDLSYLIISGKPSEKQLDDAYDTIYQLYLSKKDDQKVKTILKLKNDLVFLTARIEVVKASLIFLKNKYLNDTQRGEIIDSLAKNFQVYINKDKNILEQVSLILKNQIPSWKTNLDIQKHSYEELKKGKVSSFEEIIDGISDSKDCSLKRFLDIEKGL